MWYKIPVAVFKVIKFNTNTMGATLGSDASVFAKYNYKVDKCSFHFCLTINVSKAAFFLFLGCDVTISSTTVKSGQFSSPNWPDPYPPNKRCVYKFVGLSTERVKIRFSKFNLQGMSPE